MDQDLLPEGMTSRRWAATSANTRRRKSTGPKRSVALGRQLPGAVNMKPGTASATYSCRLRWSQLTHVQHYNTGTVAALDGQIYSSGTADFEVAMAEMLLQGFPVGGNPNLYFPALREDQVAIGVPATTQAAGSGYAPPAEIVKALNYLVLGRSFGGRYVLRKSAAYPNFRGVMTWSINWDRFAGFGFSRGVRPALNSLP